MDVVYGDDQWGEIHALNSSTGVEFMVVDNPLHGVTKILVEDFDSDGMNDLAWGAGATYSGPDNWLIVNTR